MARVTTILSTFNAGEWSADLYGRVDLAKYRNACQTLKNFIPLAQGPVTRRPGTRYVAATKNDGAVRLIQFEFSTTQAYIIEAGDGYFRFFKDRGQIVTAPNVPYEIVSPYLLADLPGLKWAQSADVLYLCHPNHPPRKLTRTGHTAWQLIDIEFNDGPYLDANTSAITLQPSALTGTAITITAAPNNKAITGATASPAGLIRITSASHGFSTKDRVIISGVAGTTEANGVWTIARVNANAFDLIGSKFTNAYVSGGNISPYLFVSTDVGRLIRIQHGATWGMAKVTGFTNAWTVTCEVLRDFGATTAQKAWRLGAWSESLGWPSCVTFYEERLFFANTRSQPQTLWGSMSGAYETFAPTAADGSVSDDHALSFTISDDRVNAIRWMSAGKTLAVGSLGGEFVVSASNLNEGLTPSNISVHRETTIGSADMQPVRIGGAVLYVQRARRKLYEMSYSFEADSYAAPELTLMARHLSAAGIKEIAYQQEPWSILWAARDDGALIGMTYLREQDVIGWHQHSIGGASARVLSISCISGNGQDELWLVVERQINGALRRYVEVLEYAMGPAETQDKADCFFVDAGITYDGTMNVTLTPGAGATTLGAQNVPFAASGNVFSAQDIGREIHYRFISVADGAARVAKARISSINAPNNVRATILAAFPNLSDIFPGNWSLSATKIAGLDHLKGESVSILADGATHPSKIVDASGTLTLDRATAKAQIGLAYDSTIVSMDIDAGALDGTAQSKMRRIHNVTARFYQTLGCEIGFNETTMEPVLFREGAASMDNSPDLLTGDKRIAFPKGWDRQSHIMVRQTMPLPCTVTALIPQLVTMDG